MDFSSLGIISFSEHLERPHALSRLSHIRGCVFFRSLFYIYKGCYRCATILFQNYLVT